MIPTAMLTALRGVLTSPRALKHVVAHAWNPLWLVRNLRRLEADPRKIGRMVQDLQGVIETPADYARWMERHERLDDEALRMQREESAAFGWRPLFSIVVPTYQTPAGILEAFVESVLAQSYSHWELCIADDASPDPRLHGVLERYAAADRRIRVQFRSSNGHIAEATNTALAMATGDYICLMDHDDTIAPNALYEFASLLNQDPDIDFIYSDEDKITPDGKTRYDPFFKPDWSPEYLEACMYTAHFACYRTSIVREVGGFRTAFNGAQDYDFVLRFTEKAGRIAHVPKVLYHWRSIPGSTAASVSSKDYVVDAGVRALSGRAERTGKPDFVRPARYDGCFELRRKVEGAPRVSIVMSATGRPVKECGMSAALPPAERMRTVMEASRYRPLEPVLVLDASRYGPQDGSDEGPEEPQAQSADPIVHVRCAEPDPNPAARRNRGAAAASGEYLLFLDEAVRIITPDWVEAMLSVAQRPGVGAVGAQLLAGNGTLRHAGVVFRDGVPGLVRSGFGDDDPGYFFSTAGQRNYLAVSGACLLVRRDHFLEVGGFDETLAPALADADLCLKLVSRGLRIVYTPQARLQCSSPAALAPTAQEEAFRVKWAGLLRRDPYYSSYFDAAPPNFDLAP
ncbi:glycosyltransferase (plasmid) [Azospirillum sp. 412522]|nr:glycosyltransferase [Azospirillum sp. 412522]MBY6266408.1 glycosyltransferase [Azospirillum sp. 412522]